MMYAIIKNDHVSNIIEMRSSAAKDFQNAVSTYDIPVAIGDEYREGKFWRNSQEVKSIRDQLNEISMELIEMEETTIPQLDELEEAVLELADIIGNLMEGL